MLPLLPYGIIPKFLPRSLCFIWKILTCILIIAIADLRFTNSSLLLYHIIYLRTVHKYIREIWCYHVQ